MNFRQMWLAFLNGDKMRRRTWRKHHWCTLSSSGFVDEQGAPASPIGLSAPHEWERWQEPAPELLYMGQAVEAFAEGKEISTENDPEHKHKLTDQKAITFNPGEKWRIVKPEPPKELSIQQAAQNPGDYKLVGNEDFPNDYIRCYHGGAVSFYASLETLKSHVQLGHPHIARFAPEARYTRIEKADE